MSGGGVIQSKEPARVLAGTIVYAAMTDVVRYSVRDRHNDLTGVMAHAANEEPDIGDEIWWGADPVIYWGPNDTKRLVKIGYSWTPE